MLSKKIFLMLMTIGFILSIFVIDVMGEDLIKLNDFQKGTVSYYDKDSIKRESKTVKVRDKIKFNEKNGDWMNWELFCIKDSDPYRDCNKLSYYMSLYEINCKEDRVCSLSVVLYDEDGKVLDTLWDPSSKWEFIASGSIEDQLKSIVCK